jgi:hypothetical protein
MNGAALRLVLRNSTRLDGDVYNSHMFRYSSFLSLVVIALSVSAQQSDKSPLGVLITPPHAVRVSQELRAALPKNVTVRLLQQTTLGDQGEEVVVYERGDRYEPHSHVAVIKGGRRIADFSLTTLFKRYDIGDTYAFFQASEFRRANGQNAFVSAFRNVGDGSGTLFVIVTKSADNYETWKQATTQDRFKILRNGDIQVWDAGDVPEGEIDCVWCPRYYKVRTFHWLKGSPTSTTLFRTRRTIDPQSFADKAIEVEK